MMSIYDNEEMIYAMIGRLSVENEELKRKLSLYEAEIDFSFKPTEDVEPNGVVLLKNIEMSGRLRNVLRNFDVKVALNEVSEYSIYDLRKAKGFGNALADELVALCNKYKIEMKP